MNTREIDRREWGEWLGLLSRLGQGHQARIEVEDLEIGDQQLTDAALAFLGVDFDPKGSSPGIDVLLESPNGATLEHHMEHPLRIYVEGDPTNVSVVDIEAADGGKLILYLEPPVDFAVDAHPPAQ